MTFFFLICSIHTTLRHTGLYSKHRCRNSIQRKLRLQQYRHDSLKSEKYVKKFRRNVFAIPFCRHISCHLTTTALQRTTRSHHLFFFFKIRYQKAACTTNWLNSHASKKPYVSAQLVACSIVHAELSPICSNRTPRQKNKHLKGCH